MLYPDTTFRAPYTQACQKVKWWKSLLLCSTVSHPIGIASTCVINSTLISISLISYNVHWQIEMPSIELCHFTIETDDKIQLSKNRFISIGQK